MGLLEMLLIAVGLSMDALAVSMCKGLCMKTWQGRQALLIALFFGGFQAGMPLLGWLAGRQFERYIRQYDHWIAFGLLAFIGVRMLVEALRKEKDGKAFNTAVSGSARAQACPVGFSLRELLLLAVATSIDALAVGVTFAFLQVKILPAAAVIGLTTFVLSGAGVALGHRFGTVHRKRAEIAGGVVLVLIGLKILAEHLSHGG